MHTGVYVCVGKYNYNFMNSASLCGDHFCAHVYIYIAFRQSQISMRTAVCAKADSVRVFVCGRGIFDMCVCMFVFIVAEMRLCCGQNNLTSRCAEACGKSIQMMAPKQVMSTLS